MTSAPSRRFMTRPRRADDATLRRSSYPPRSPRREPARRWRRPRRLGMPGRRMPRSLAKRRRRRRRKSKSAPAADPGTAVGGWRPSPCRSAPAPALGSAPGLRTLGTAAFCSRDRLPLYSRRRPIPFRGRLLDPLRGRWVGRSGAARRPNLDRQGHRLRHRHSVRIHPRPGDRGADRRQARPPGEYLEPRRIPPGGPATQSSPSAATPRSRPCIASGCGWSRSATIPAAASSMCRCALSPPRMLGRSPVQSSQNQARW